MAKFLFCLPRYHTNLVPWSKLLQEAGHEVSIDVTGVGPTENWGFVIPTCHSPSRLCNAVMGRKLHGPDAAFHVFPSFRQYWRHLRNVNPDVVIVRGVTRWFPRIVALCAVLQGRRLVIYDQEDTSPKRWSSTWLRRALFKIIGIPHMTPRLPKGAECSRLGDATALPFGCPFPIATKTAGEGWDHWPARLLMVGKYRTRKGHSQLLDALALVAKNSSFSVTFCGEEIDGADTAFCEALQKKAETLGLASVLTFRNNISHNKMDHIYRQHDVVILPSWNESGGMSPVEGAWMKCAAIVSNEIGTRGYFPPGPDFHFNPHDPADVARAIEKVIATPEALRNARTACYDHISRVAGAGLIVATFERFLN